MKWIFSFLLATCLAGATRAQTASVVATNPTYNQTAGVVTLAVTLTFPQPLTALGLSVATLPPGWTYQGTGGSDVPPLLPVAGQTESLDYAYTSVPPSPVTFTMQLAYPAGMSGIQTLSGITAIFRDSVSPRLSVLVPNITFSPAGSVPTTPVILNQPSSQAAPEGANVTFIVVASGNITSYQWTKDGANVPGAIGPTLTLSNLTTSATGAYAVRITGPGGTVSSAAATLTVSRPAGPTITTQPASQTVTAGSNVTFTVAASGGAPLMYSWRKDGTAIGGATNATYTIANAAPSAAGAYSVVVSNATGMVTSSPAALTVTPAPGGFDGTYFGTLGGTGGTFALLVRPDRSGVFLGYIRASGVALVSRIVHVDATGNFGFSVSGAAPVGGSPGAADIIYSIEGNIAANGGVSATVFGLGLTLAGARAAATGATGALAGFYPGAAAGRSTTSYAIVGAAGDAYFTTIGGGEDDAGRGTVAATGQLTVTTERNSVVSGLIQPQGVSRLTLTPTAGGPVSFVAINPDARTDAEKLVNISTRSRTGTATETLIAGFVIGGEQPKTMLLRAIGPTLQSFNVSGALAAVHLEIFKGSTKIAEGDDWGASTSANAIAETAARVGAFALPSSSRDAALLLTLEPGAYSAVVSGQGGASGVALLEAYDATVNVNPRALGIVNISTRATAGAAENALIAGFVITGTVPKRVLVRGIGPALAAFGVSGVLIRPVLAIYSGTTVLVQNEGWARSPDAGMIASAAAQVGAFPLSSISPDAGVIVNLAPGAYSAQVTGADGASGVALVEVYEVP